MPPVEGIFYDGQIFDAYVFATDLIRSAKHSLILIDNYIDENALLMLSKRRDGVIVDEDVYYIGASLKDLGKKLVAFSKMTISKDLLIGKTDSRLCTGEADSARRAY